MSRIANPAVVVEELGWSTFMAAHCSTPAPVLTVKNVKATISNANAQFNIRSFDRLRPQKKRTWTCFCQAGSSKGTKREGIVSSMNKADTESKEIRHTEEKTEEKVEQCEDDPINQLGRREALTLGLSLPLALATDSQAWFGRTHPAQALIQTGREREGAQVVGGVSESLKSRVSTFTLQNGMRWIVLERHNAPVVACHTYADVGAANEVSGVTGIAHLLEHLSFKGTKNVGTRDATTEADLLDQLDAIFYALQDAKKEGRISDIEHLSKMFVEIQARAAQLSVPNEYGALISRQGGVGLNAQTSQDKTEYYVSLPANKLELWMALESSRFIAPVFRELYSEKEVVKEERRLRVDNTPFGRFTEAFTQAAFPDHPYGRPVIGYPNDFELIGRREVTSFFREHYTPNAVTCAVVGDVDPLEVERLANYYFGHWVPDNTPKTIAASTGQGLTWRQGNGWDTIVRADSQRTLRMSLPAQPLYLEGYYRPAASSTDSPTISVVNELLASGRLSRFYKRIIVPGKALSADSVESFPGDKQPCLFLIYAYPPSGLSTDYVAGVLHQELEDLASKPVGWDELVPVKKAARTSLLEALGNNEGMAKILCGYEATTGAWVNLLDESVAIEAVSPAQVHHTAALLFHEENRITGHVQSLRASFS